MAKTIKVRWNGAKEDPDSITQYGVRFDHGVWTDVPHDEKNAEHVQRMAKLKGNKFFEVKGEKPEDVQTVADAFSAPKP